MGLRTFVAPDGEEWRVWKVIPTRTLEDVREWDRRGQDVLSYDGPERRQEGHEALPFVSPALAQGWLCFESVRGKRRLAPPPVLWEDAPEEELATLWEKADVVPPREERVRGASRSAS